VGAVVGFENIMDLTAGRRGLLKNQAGNVAANRYLRLKK
jgi:hypothetical protein